MRYDAAWGRFSSRREYDEWLRRGQEGFDRALSGRNRPVEGFGDSDLGSGRYGPARYGLGPYHERLRRRRREDTDLKKDVEEALFYDTWVDADAITVEVSEGVVKLRGVLPSYEEVRFATDDAWDVEGVVGVRPELTVDDP